MTDRNSPGSKLRRRRMAAAMFKARKEAGKLPPKPGEVKASLDFLAGMKIPKSDKPKD